MKGYLRPTKMYQALVTLKVLGNPYYQSIVTKCLYCPRIFNDDDKDMLEHVKQCLLKAQFAGDCPNDGRDKGIDINHFAICMISIRAFHKYILFIPKFIIYILMTEDLFKIIMFTHVLTCRFLSTPTNGSFNCQSLNKGLIIICVFKHFHLRETRQPFACSMNTDPFTSTLSANT